MVPAAFGEAVRLAASVVAEAGVAIDVLDLGGGFPVAYTDMTPPPLDAFFAAVEVAMSLFARRPRLWCEPGRALVAAGASVVAKVEARRGRTLHLNDGVFGNLYDLRADGLKLPARLIRLDDRVPSNELVAFSFYGPTCDSVDHMAGPFMLPADIDVGDWIELGQLGAYSACLRTAFNGFDRTLFAHVRDAAMQVPAYEADVDALRRAA
jgi:ornithine decarboxylase